MTKFELKQHEFAVKEGAKFLPNLNNPPLIKINKNGTMSITFSYVIDDINNLQSKLGAIEFLNSGVFNENQPNNYKTAGNVSGLTLLSTPADDILLTSDSGDIDITTEGEKGREGLSFVIEAR
ncbi:MAG: hypothetical protein JWP94_493 [Mucilaginibacter sp.]|nr:hypothetical protein [Mucilaginibacter sp.]